MGKGVEKNRGGGPELPRELVNTITPGMRQGLVIINDPREAEDIVRVFTGMIINKDPNKVDDWRREYIRVNEEEFREELKLLAIPLIRKLPIMTAVKMPTGREYPAILRKFI